MNSADDAFDAVLHEVNIEIDEQSETQSGGFEVRQQLRLVDGSEAVDAFEFHDDSAADQQIEDQKHGFSLIGQIPMDLSVTTLPVSNLDEIRADPSHLF